MKRKKATRNLKKRPRKLVKGRSQRNQRLRGVMERARRASTGGRRRKREKARTKRRMGKGTRSRVRRRLRRNELLSELTD